MNSKAIFFLLLVIQSIFSQPPDFITCKNVEQVFAGSANKWKCENNGKVLSSGSSGLTYVISNTEQTKAICKVMYCNKYDSTDSAMVEIRVLKKINGLPNIIKFYENQYVNVAKKGGIAMIVQEFAENGNLLNFANKNPSYFNDPRKVMKMMAGICNGVKEMHKKDLVHADIKSENIVVDANLVPKLIDFDLTNEMDKPGEFKGTPEFIDPRLFKKNRIFDEKVDVYSLGVVLSEIAFGFTPFSGETLDDIKSNIQDGEFDIPKNTEINIAKIVASCIQVDAARRPTMNQLIQMIDDYLKTDEDMLLDMVVLSNKKLPDENDFHIIEVKDRSADAKNFRAGRRALALENKEEKRGSDFDWIFPLVLAVSSVLMFVIFKAMTTWIDNLRHSAKAVEAERSTNSSVDNDNDLSISIESIAGRE